MANREFDAFSRRKPRGRGAHHRGRPPQRGSHPYRANYSDVYNLLQNQEETDDASLEEKPTNEPKNDFKMTKKLAKQIQAGLRSEQIQKKEKTGDKAMRQFYAMKEYKAGVNTEGQSDYELQPNIPVFSAEERANEKRICQKIFEINQSALGLSANDLFDRYCEKEGKEDFESIEEFIKFIRSRSNVFHIAKYMNAVENRGFGYRRGAVYLACIVRKNQSSQEGTSIRSIFEEAKALPTHEINEPFIDQFIWTRPLTANDLLLYFKEHSRHYIVIEDTAENSKEPEKAVVRLTEEAMRIPSLWDSTLLPTIFNLAIETYWDQSRVFPAVGVVIAAQRFYAKVLIACGPYAGRRVYVLGSHVGLSDRSLYDIFPVDSQVAMLIHPALFTANEFRAVKIQNLHDPMDEENKVKSLTDKLIEEQQEIKAKENLEKSFALEAAITRRLIDAINNCQEASEDQDENSFEMEVLFECVSKQAELQSLFPTIVDLASHLTKRPHIFDTSSEGFVSLQPDDYKAAYFEFIYFLHKAQPYGVRTTQLRENLLTEKFDFGLSEIVKNDEHYEELLRAFAPIMPKRFYNIGEDDIACFVYYLSGEVSNDGSFFPGETILAI